MSLISLNSRPTLISQSNEPNNFRNNYPQTLKILPKSQVALLKFVHFRESGEISISSANNRFFFVIGDLDYDTTREVILENGDYTDEKLAEHIQEKMNAINHQQNFRFKASVITTGSVGFTQIKIDISHTDIWASANEYQKGDLATESDVYYLAKTDNTNAQPSTSADDWERLIRGGKWSIGVGGQSGYREEDSSGQSSVITGYQLDTGIFGERFSMVMERGMLTNDGIFYTQGIPLVWNDTMGSDAQTYGFLPLYLGISTIEYDVDNIQGNYEDLPLSIEFTSDGELIFGENQFGSGRLNQKIIDLNGILPALTDKANVLSTQLRVIISSIGADDKLTDDDPSKQYFIVQLEFTTDNGASYTTLPDSGTDIETKTKNGGITYTGIAFISTEHLAKSKVAPFQPVVALQTSLGNQEVKTFGCPNLASKNPRTYTETGGKTLTFNDFVIDDNEFQATINDGGTTTQLDLVGALYGSNRLLFNYTGGNFSYDPNTYTLTQIEGGTTTTWSNAGDGLDFVKVDAQFETTGLFNPVNTGIAITSLSSKKNVDESVILKEFSSDKGVNLTESSGSKLAGSVLSKPVGLYLGRLTYDDNLVNPDYVPLSFVSDTSKHGTIWKTIGSSDGFVLTPSLSSGSVFLSNAPIQRADEGFMSISISELMGVKSFEGARSNIGKTIAMITRDELSRSDEHANKYSYIAPFENYIDINNIDELNINMLTCQVRDTDGMLLEGMYGATQLVLKIRQDPEYKKLIDRERMLRKDITETGQILSQDIMMTGS